MLNRLFCPAIIVVAVFVLANFAAWILCRIAALSDEAMGKEQKE